MQNFRKNTQQYKAIHALINKSDHTLSNRELIIVTGCISPSNLITCLTYKKNCEFRTKRGKNEYYYTLLNADNFVIDEEV